MQTGLPDLTQLTSEEKDDLIRQLWPLIAQIQELMAQMQELMAQNARLQERVTELEGRLALNSRNSSKPPSTDGMKPKPKSLREVGMRPTGGQKGHEGNTLRKVGAPDQVITHPPQQTCDVCQRSIADAELWEAEARQVFDLPSLRFEVTEHRVMQTRCTCGKIHRGKFPEHVRASVQYGPRVLATMVHLSHHHMMPVQRSAALIDDMFGLRVSQARVLAACEEAAERLTPCVEGIAQALQTASVAHADETGMRVNKTLHWMHVVASKTLTWMARHVRRGKVAIEELGLLPNFKGTLIHDGWKSYRALTCTHGLCNAHHLRELTYVHEELGQAWAGDMISLLKHAHQKAQSGKLLDPQQIEHMRYVYEVILDQGDTANPRNLFGGKRGRIKQSKATNLLIRLREHADDVWRFMYDPTVPFTNNIAEQAVRMPKVKQKISGCFRTTNGADIFCVIRSYLATMYKQGANLMDVLINIFFGSTPYPNFS
jgi:transposase